MNPLDTKRIVYDSNCKVCTSMRNMMVAYTSIPASQITAYKDLSAAELQRIDPERFKNEMALIDLSGGATLYGAEGVAHIFASQYRLIAWLLRFRIPYSIFTFLYNVQANNRYIMATPYSKFECDCLPAPTLRYRLAYIVITYLIAIGLTALLGMSLANLGGTTLSRAAAQMLLIAGTGWVLQLSLAAAFMRSRKLEYFGHAGSIMVAGLLVLIPWMLLHAVTGITNPWIPAVSMVISSGLMLYLHIGRIRYLKLTQAWTITWFVLLQTTAAAWVWFLYGKS